MKSPLLFVPVALQTTARGWRLKREEGVGIEANLTLLGYLQTPNILVQIDDEDEVDADACPFQASSGLPDGTFLYRPHAKALSYPTMAMDDWAARIVQAEGPLHKKSLWLL